MFFGIGERKTPTLAQMEKQGRAVLKAYKKDKAAVEAAQAKMNGSEGRLLDFNKKHGRALQLLAEE